jgi:superfamily II DNA helicase RecQ
MVIRGLPTRTSPYIEKVFESLGNQKFVDELGNIRFVHNKLHTDNLLATVECLTPIAIARVQKTIFEALMTSRIRLSEKKWRVLVVERDVPCAAIAFEDLKQMFDHLAALSMDYSNLKFPEIQLEIISKPEFTASPLHLGIQTATTPTYQQKTTEYDMVIDVSVFFQSDIENLQFSEFSKCKNNCYFNIRSAVKKRSERYIYTSDTIKYKPLVSKDGQGIYKEISKTKDHLQYFLQLLFRKEDFRPGQLPILDRALQNKSVIGLLPTGGGKSLTYQLAAMLQPGVTIIIDPLRSLMKDQYDGLIKTGIDTCTFINSTQDPKEKEASAKQMESSQMQFVFMSPERLCIYKFRERLQTMRELNVYFAYGVIDEVHCVSEWGHDFRFSYLHLGRNLYNYVLPKNKEKRITLFGLTATASFDVLADVERELSGNGAFSLDSDTIIRYENTNRLELQYKVEKVDVTIKPGIIDPKWEVYKTKNETTPKFISKIPYLIDELQTSESIDFIKSRFIERENLDNEANKEQVGNTKKSDLTIKLLSDWLKPKEIYSSGGIVFCPHTKGLLGIDSTADNKGIADIIKTSLKCTVGTFKGGDGMNDQDRFINNERPIMVATKAFGMGIDKPNVRFTLNVNMSSSLEGFVQEAGRAGRDKRMALATVLFSDIKDVDKDVQMYFHDNNFKGKEFEKKIMNKLLSHNKTDVFIGDDVEFKDGFDTVTDFLEKYFSAEINTEIVALIKYPQQKNVTCKFDFVFWEGIEVKLVKEVKDKVIIEHLGVSKKVKKEEVIFKSDISKAIYRMTCIELISDFTEDYTKNRYRIVTKRKAEGDFYLNLKRFLLRYYSTDRAELEIKKVKALILPKPPDSDLKKELYQCLNYLTEFIYEKIAIKRKRAIDDMKTFCAIGIDNSKDWKLVNEELKDFLYYYFNSKYAKGDYTANNEELFSLTTDTDFGKGKDLKFSPDIVFKYMRVIDIDDPMFGPGETPKDNAKHLQGAVRLIRRSLTDINPALDLLNAFCCFI